MLASLITNRTVSDVEAVRALTEAIKTGTATEEQVRQYLTVHQKGAYTHEDMNRVEAAVEYVANRLIEYGYLNVALPVAAWRVEDKPDLNEFTRYFVNVRMLRDAITVWSSTPEAPSGITGFDYNKANALEQILIDVDDVLTKVSQAWLYSGDLYSAEV